MAKIIKIIFVLIAIVAIFATAYYLGIVANLNATTPGIRNQFTDFLPPEILVIFGLIVLGIVISIVYSLID